MRNLDNQNMLLQNYLEGYNLEYSSNCTFIDEKGELQCCKEGLKDGEETIDYTFPLDFVTSERSVHMSFPIGKYYFVLDTQGKIYIMEFPSSLEKK